MKVAGGEGDHATQATDLHRGEAVACAAIAQLAVAVAPPGPDRAVALQGEAVIDARYHACTGEMLRVEGRGDRFGGIHAHRAGAGGAGAGATPAGEGRAAGCVGGQGDRSAAGVGLVAIRAAIDAGRAAGDRTRTGAVPAHLQGVAGLLRVEGRGDRFGGIHGHLAGVCATAGTTPAGEGRAAGCVGGQGD